MFELMASGTNESQCRHAGYIKDTVVFRINPPSYVSSKKKKEEKRS